MYLSCDALRDLPRVSAGHLSVIQRYLHRVAQRVCFKSAARGARFYIVYMTAMVSLTVLAALRTVPTRCWS
jgi:hypothetical protein